MDFPAVLCPASGVPFCRRSYESLLALLLLLLSLPNVLRQGLPIYGAQACWRASVRAGCVKLDVVTTTHGEHPDELQHRARCGESERGLATRPWPRLSRRVSSGGTLNLRGSEHFTMLSASHSQ